MSKVMICGDIHGNFKLFNNIINNHEVDLVIQVGDFGYWPKSKYNVEAKTVFNSKYDTKDITYPSIIFIDGNHENHEELKNLDIFDHVYIKDHSMRSIFHNVSVIKQPVVYNKVQYMRRGSRLNINGKSVLFIGGANSIDKAIRTPGFDWFTEETIKENDLNNVLDNTEPIDIVISHTCPTEIFKDICNKRTLQTYDNDPSREYLQIILDEYNPKQWYFGHFHFYDTGIYKNTNWACLNNIENNTNINNFYKIIEI